MTVHNASVGYAGRMQTKKVNILRDNTAPRSAREREVILVRCAHQAGVSRCRYVNASMAESIREHRGNVLVQMKGDGHPLRCLFEWLPTQLLVQERRAIAAKLFDICAFRSHSGMSENRSIIAARSSTGRRRTVSRACWVSTLKTQRLT